MSMTSLGPKPNLILFDQQSSSSYVHPTPSQTQLTKNPDVITLLTDLNKRILKIQIYQQVLRDKTHSLQNKSNPLSTTNINITGNNHQQIINVLERKLHMLIIETNKALEDLKDEVERILTREIMEKKVSDYQSKGQNQRLERVYLEKIKEMESQHAGEIVKLERRNQAIEKGFQQKMERIESKLINKIKEFERREEGYRAEIERLRVQTIDTKKFQQLELELQQTKIALRNLPQKQFKQSAIPLLPAKTMGMPAGGNITTGAGGGNTGMTMGTAGTMGMTGGLTSRLEGTDKDTNHSRMRRNKIFQKKQQQGPSVIINPVQVYQYSQVASMNILSKQLQDLTSQLQIHFNPNNSGSDQDVFFYPEASKARMAPELQSSTQIASPFDLNNRY